MPQDTVLKRFGSPVEELTTFPRPICCECGQGHIRFPEPTKFEHGDPKEARDHPAWEPDWIKGTFTSSGTCENTACRYTVSASGTYKTSYAKDGPGHEYQGSHYAEFYSFKHFSPALRLMDLPAGTPDPVRDGVARAAAVLFTDPGLAATALRLVVEQFLTTQGIPEKRTSGGFIGADERIKTWRDQDAANRGHVAGLLLAAKWIGNAGTHSLSTLTVDQVLESADYLGEAFHELFVTPEIRARAKAINDAKGPVPPATT